MPGLTQQEVSAEIAAICKEARALIKQAEDLATEYKTPFEFSLGYDLGAKVGGTFEVSEYDTEETNDDGYPIYFEEIYDYIDSGEEAEAVAEWGQETVDRAKEFKDKMVWTRWKSSSEFC